MDIRRVREPSVEDVLGARDVVSRHLPTTPVIASPLLGDRVMLKLETLQPTGSFKVRGGLAALAGIRSHDPDAHVVTASAGNHGLGVAYAAQALGVRATVVVPENASSAKQAALERFTGSGQVELIRHGTTYGEAEAHALELAEAGAIFVSAYNDPDVIAGQGSIVLELFEQVQDLTTIVVPVGGGGLLSGLALGAQLRPGIELFGVEAAASPAVSASVKAGHVVEITDGPTIADGLAGNIEMGTVTVPLIARLVNQLVQVDEPDIRDAVGFLAREHGLVVEPSGAIGAGAMSAGLITTADVSARGTTVIILTGRNLSPALMVDLLSGEQ
jgi:threonine dehydratase